MIEQSGVMEKQRANSQIKIICSVCSGTGMRPFECGPRGATWTDYERCTTCKGVGHFAQTSPKGENE